MLSVFFRLDEALSQYFGAAAEGGPTGSPCRLCRAHQEVSAVRQDMVLKTRKDGGVGVWLCLTPTPARDPVLPCGPILWFCVLFKSRPASPVPGPGAGAENGGLRGVRPT